MVSESESKRGTERPPIDVCVDQASCPLRHYNSDLVNTRNGQIIRATLFMERAGSP